MHRHYQQSLYVCECRQAYVALRYIFILKNNTFEIVFRFQNDRQKKYLVCLRIYLHIKMETASLVIRNMNLKKKDEKMQI
jgi:hypothetical protein